MQTLRLSSAGPSRYDAMAALRRSITTNPALREIPAADALVVESREDREARRYWERVTEFKRFGRTDFYAEGTPFVGDAFGF